MVKAEYARFLQILSASSVSADIRKIANLVEKHLSDIILLGTAKGGRSKKLVVLAQAEWDSISESVLPLTANVVGQAVKLNRLKEMRVGPFRGFLKQKVFELSKRYILIYGPNGTGKSSFCEALEYCLLGSVKEGEERRFKNDSYLKNVYVNRFEPPKLMALNDGNEKFQVTPDEALYRFCFIEKNRIDAFSRIAAQTSAKQGELISALFGLDAFAEFVGDFSKEIDSKYIDIVGVKGLELAQKKRSLEGAKQQILSHPIELNELILKEQNLANQYRQGADYDTVMKELNGEGEIQGKIEKLEAELQKTIQTKSDVTNAALTGLFTKMGETISSWNAVQGKLAAESQKLSFKQLYEAVSQPEVQKHSPDKCPVCQTPLRQTVENPYAYADSELQKLRDLARLQEEERTCNADFLRILTQLSSIINICLKYYPNDNPLKQYELGDGKPADTDWWNSFSRDSVPRQTLEKQVKQLEEQDKTIAQAEQIKAQQLAERNRLREYAEKFKKFQAQKELLFKQNSENEELIKKFNEENKDLIQAAVEEKSVVERNKRIVSAYSEFAKTLNEYYQSLPAALVADLGSRIVELYNQFNRNDSQNELLADIKLPLGSGEALEIASQSNPKQFCDALQILSEGHIRCLGLAILVAKNIKENAPLIIFDDPVNAIDDDHRKAIREVFFGDGKDFSGKQIIMACHGEEFFKDIQNQLPAGRAKNNIGTFTFLHRGDELDIQIDFSGAPCNYILAARKYLGKGKIRDTLAEARRALEALGHNRLWIYVCTKGDGNLSLKLRGSKAPIELRNLIEQLRSKIVANDFRDSGKNAIVDPLDKILAIDGNSMYWRYLNKGTHEEADRAEFERGTVEEIISAIEAIDRHLG